MRCINSEILLGERVATMYKLKALEVKAYVFAGKYSNFWGNSIPFVRFPSL